MGKCLLNESKITKGFQDTFPNSEIKSPKINETDFEAWITCFFEKPSLTLVPMAAIHLKDVSMYYAVLLLLAFDDTICPKNTIFKVNSLI